jgi:hypothetical protein
MGLFDFMKSYTPPPLYHHGEPGKEGEYLSPFPSAGGGSRRVFHDSPRGQSGASGQSAAGPAEGENNIPHRPNRSWRDDPRPWDARELTVMEKVKRREAKYAHWFEKMEARQAHLDALGAGRGSAMQESLGLGGGRGRGFGRGHGVGNSHPAWNMDHIDGSGGAGGRGLGGPAGSAGGMGGMSSGRGGMSGFRGMHSGRGQ